MRALTLGDRTVVWGHSQGGHAALWTGITAPRYAPDVSLAGVVAIAPAADMRHILDLNEDADKRLAPYLALAYSRFYPDVTFEQALRPEAVAAAREMATLCGFFPRGDPKRIAALAASFDGRASAVDADTPFVARLKQNAATGAIAAPVVIAQGGADGVVSARATDAYVGARCAAGQPLEYWTFASSDHGSIVQPGTPLEAPLTAWTRARFADRQTAVGCVRRSF